MTTIQDLIATYLGSYDFTVDWDVPYIVAACCLLLGLWFTFKVILALIHSLTGGKH